MPNLKRYRVVDANNSGIDKLAVQVDAVDNYYAEAMIPVDVTGTPLGSAGNPLVVSGAGVSSGSAAVATAAAPTYLEGQSVPLSVDLSGTLRSTAGAGGGGGGAVTVADGADVAQGATSDVAWTIGAGTVVGLLKAVVGAVKATLITDPVDRAARLLGHVSVDNFPATQPVSGVVTANAGTGTFTTDVSDRLARLLGHVTVDNASIPVTGTFWQAAQPVTDNGTTLSVDDGAGSLTVDGTVSVGNFPATQPVSGTVTANAGTGVFDVTPTVPTATDYLPVRLTDGAAFYTAGGGAGGGASTIADGADVAQGTTTDLAWTTGAGTVIGLLKAVVGAIKATLLADVTDRAARLLGHVTVDNASIPVTGTFWQATQPVSGTLTANQGTANATPWNENLAQVNGTAMGSPTAKGTQATGNVLCVQEMHDTGRQQISLVWEAQTMSTSESALASFTSGSRNGAALTAATSYTVSAGKTLRLQSVNIFVKNVTSATAFGDSRVRIRQAVSGIANSSPIIWEAQIGWNNYASTVVTGGNNQQFYELGGDGLEVAGGQQITFTHLDTTSNGQVSAALSGYEY